MLDWLAKKIESFTENKHAGEVTVVYDQYAADPLIISWVNEREDGLIFKERSLSSMSISVDKEALQSIRHFQDLSGEVMGYALQLPLGEFKVATVVTGGGENYMPFAVRILDCHGNEDTFLINGNYLRVVLPSNDVKSAEVFQYDDEVTK